MEFNKEISTTVRTVLEAILKSEVKMNDEIKFVLHSETNEIEKKTIILVSTEVWAIETWETDPKKTLTFIFDLN